MSGLMRRLVLRNLEKFKLATSPSSLHLNNNRNLIVSSINNNKKISCTIRNYSNLLNQQQQVGELLVRILEDGQKKKKNN
jgi:hypothetical protein